jgi:hypothetical protein
MVVPVRDVPWWGVLSSAAAPVLLVGGWMVAAMLQPGSFDQVRQTISALAAYGAADRQVMSVALLGVGVCHVVTGLALRPAAWPGRVLLMTGGVAAVLVAAFPDLRPASAAEPLRLESLRAELPDPGDVTHQIPDPVSRRRDVDRHRTTHHTSIKPPKRSGPAPCAGRPSAGLGRHQRGRAPGTTSRQFRPAGTPPQPPKEQGTGGWARAQRALR